MIFHILVQKDNAWHELDLPKDFNLQMVLNSGFLGSKQSGSFSFTSTLPTTANNCQILQNVQYPQVIADRKIQLPAKLLVGSTEFYSWYFILRKASSKTYSYDLIQTPGNQSRFFYEQKLWALDFGKLNLASVPKKSPIWTLDLYDSKKLYKYFISPAENPIDIFFPGFPRLPNPVYFEIWINNILIVQTPTSSIDGINYWFNEKDPEKRFLIVTKNITDYTIVMSIPKRGLGSLDVVAKSGQVINSVQLKIYDHYMANLIEKGAFIVQYDYVNLMSDDVTEAITTISKAPADYPFKFLTYFNDSYYPAENTQYEGIVNQYDTNKADNTLKLNGGFELNTYPVSPCFSLKFILEKVAKMMGYTLKADIFQNKAIAGELYLGDLYVITNKDLAAQVPGTAIPCNTYGTVINYAYFMPDMTVKEFIDAIRTTFCLSVEYDFFSSTMIITKCKETILSNEVIDISNKLEVFPTAEIIDKTYFQLGFKSGDTNIISQKNYPTDESIADDGNDYTKIEAGFTPVLNNFDLDPFAVYDPNPYIPTVNDTSRSVIYQDQKNNHPSPKICFYLGNDNNGLQWAAKSDNNNGKICLSWVSKGTQKGLLEAFYQEYLDFINNTVQWSSQIFLTELELANFKFAQKYYAYGTIFMVETLNPKLPVKDSTAIKLLSV